MSARKRYVTKDYEMVYEQCAQRLLEADNRVSLLIHRKGAALPLYEEKAIVNTMKSVHIMLKNLCEMTSAFSTNGIGEVITEDDESET